MNTGYDQYRPRRRSVSGGFPSGGLAPPPHSDGGYRRGDGFSDPYNNNSSYPEVSGPPPFPPPGAAHGLSGNMSFPDSPLSSHPSQPFASGAGSYPSSVGMPASYPIGAREPHSFSAFDSSSMNPTGLAPPPAAYSNSYDNSPLSDNQYVSLDDNNYSSRGRTLSASGGYGPQALIPSAPPMTPYPSQYSGKRMRRASSVGPGMGMGYAGIVGEPYNHRPGGHVTIKFRLKGSNHSGISVGEALERVRLSQGNAYLMHDIAPDMYGKIALRVRWSGYRSNTYNMPLSADYHGYVDLQSLARRASRAIVHFMQSNGIALPWNRVVIHRLEEISPGTWIPVLTTH